MLRPNVTSKRICNTPFLPLSTYLKNLCFSYVDQDVLGLVDVLGYPVWLESENTFFSGKGLKTDTRAGWGLIIFNWKSP